MLSEIQNHAFRIHQMGFSYLPLHPITWNFKQQKFQYTKTKSSTIFFVFSLLLCIHIAASCVYTVLTHLYIAPRPNFNTGIIALHTFCAFLTLIPLSLVILVARHSETMAGDNALIQLNGSADKQKLDFKSIKQVELMDLMLLGTAAGAPPLPFVALLTTVFFKIDPYYYIFGDLLGDPGFKNTSSLTNIICLILRAFTICCGFECARTISLAVICLFLIIEIVQKQFQTLFAARIDDLAELKNRLVQFIHLTIVFLSIRAHLQEGLTLAITASFWGTVLGIWMILNTFNSIPIFLYIFICTAMLIVVLGVFFGLTVLSKFCERSECLTSKLKRKAKKMYANCKTVSMRKELLIMKKRTGALETIKIYYHPFLPIDSQFCRDTASNLVDRILDTCLIF